MATPEKGFLLIADISGYTSFLSKSELEPAAEHLRVFLDLLIEHTKPPLLVSRLQGDAVISYAPEGSFLQGQTLVEMIEETYLAFRKALDLTVLNNQCDCSACSLIPSLDLKFFAHHGDFLMQRLGTHTELIGPEVNIVFRLTKNRIVEKTGIKAYVAYTKAAVSALRIEEQAEFLLRHEEEYEDVGRVTLYVQDMHQVWEEKQAGLRRGVTLEDALFVVEKEYPVAPVLMWDYVTKPEYNAILTGTRNARVSNRSQGRIGPGTVYQCSRGNSITPHTIVEWEPFEEYTYESPRPLGVLGRTTIRLESLDHGTKVRMLFSKSTGGSSLRCKLQDMAYRLTGQPEIARGQKELRDVVAQDVANGQVVMSTTMAPTREELDREVVESLTR
jgi:hypothetical protein